METPTSGRFTILVGDDEAEDLLVTCVGPGLYRVHEGEFDFSLCELFQEDESWPKAGDVIRADPVDAKTIRYRSLHERGHYRQYSFVLSPELVKSAAFDAYLEDLVKSGGMWEQIMGGMLFISLPPDSPLDPVAQLSALRGRV